MASVRRISGDMVEVLFTKPLSPTSNHGEALASYADEREDFDLILGDDGTIEGLTGNSKDYIAFLKSRNVSPKTIDGLRRALDDSKRAVRQRMRGR